MRRKSLWFLASTVIILAMLLTACKTETATTTTAATTTAATTTAATTTATTTTTPTTTTTATTTAGAPKYGGTMTVALSADLSSYDSWSTNPHAFARQIYDSMLTGNIQVTKEEWPAYGMYWPTQYLTGCLIESWEEPAIGTVIFHLRQGVHFQNIPPVNGREFTADDVAYSIARAANPIGQIATAQLLTYIKSVTALDKYTAEFIYDPSFYPGGKLLSTMHKANVWPIAHEVVEKYGNLSNPIGQVGTGPYMIKDYVPGSAFTCVRNPDYWGTDPRYPGNKLPYIDMIITTVIPDLSTQLAALRTGKISRLGSVPWDQAESLKQTNPELLSRQILTESSTYISPRNDIPPFKDIRVRQALSMAIDRHALVDQYFQGNAQYSNYLVPEHWPEFIPLDQFSAEIQEIYNYNPEKARQLLAEAGYLTGFNTEIIVSSTNRSGIDVMQLIKTWWADIGVNLDIKVLEAATHSSIRYKHTFPGMALGGGGISYPNYGFSFLYQPKGEFRTYATTEWADSTYNEKYLAMLNSWDKPQAEQEASFRDLITYTREQTPYIELPTANNYLYWQPWLKGHWGQAALTFSSAGDFYKYMWIDK